MNTKGKTILLFNYYSFATSAPVSSEATADRIARMIACRKLHKNRKNQH